MQHVRPPRDVAREPRDAVLVALAVAHARRQVYVERGDGHGARGEQARDGGTEAAGRAGDEDDLAGAGGGGGPDERPLRASGETSIEGVEGTEGPDGECIEEQRAEQSVGDEQGQEDRKRREDRGKEGVESERGEVVDGEHCGRMRKDCTVCLLVGPW